VVVTDQDGDTAGDTLNIAILDDGPQAVADSAVTGEDAVITYNVIANADGTGDVAGADAPLTLTAVQLVSGVGTVTGFDASGTITVQPGSGYAGDIVLGYTVSDGDGDTSESSLVITVGADSEPTVVVSDGEVDEAALDGGSDASSEAETTTGVFTIATGGDALASLVVGGEDVTGGGTVSGVYGELTVSQAADGSYSWRYTLGGNTTDHPDAGSTGTAEGVEDVFAVVVTDQDGDTAGDTLNIAILDDGPQAVADSAVTGEDALHRCSYQRAGAGSADVQRQSRQYCSGWQRWTGW
jgi:hypothetical protein